MQWHTRSHGPLEPCGSASAAEVPETERAPGSQLASQSGGPTAPITSAIWDVKSWVVPVLLKDQLPDLKLPSGVCVCVLGAMKTGTNAFCKILRDNFTVEVWPRDAPDRSGYIKLEGYSLWKHTVPECIYRVPAHVSHGHAVVCVCLIRDPTIWLASLAERSYTLRPEGYLDAPREHCPPALDWLTGSAVTLHAPAKKKKERGC